MGQKLETNVLDSDAHPGEDQYWARTRGLWTHPYGCRHPSSLPHELFAISNYAKFRKYLKLTKSRECGDLHALKSQFSNCEALFRERSAKFLNCTLSCCWEHSSLPGSIVVLFVRPTKV